MNEAQFREILELYFVPMFAGSFLGDAKKASQIHKPVAFDNPCALLLKPSGDANFRVAIKRRQPFTPTERLLVERYLHEFYRINAVASDHHKNDLMNAAPREVIAHLLPGTSAARNTLHRCLTQFETLAAQTYEGRPIVTAMGMTGSIGHGAVKLDLLWKEDFSKVVANGFDSMFLCDSNGRVFNVTYEQPRVERGFFPGRLSAIARWTTAHNRVALVLNRNSDILVFSEGELQFAKRRGTWRYFPHEAIISRLGVGSKDLKDAIYETCLDVSFARTGGCLALVTTRNMSGVAKRVTPEDMLSGKKYSRTKLLKLTANRPFHRLDRRLRQELLSIDGATVLKHDGTLLAVGAIVRVPGGSTGGGRKAAALELSKLGLGIKISADGPIAGYRNKNEEFLL